MNKTFTPLLTGKQVAEWFGVSYQKVRTDTARGKIPCIKLGRSCRYDPIAIKKFLNDNTIG